MKKYYLILITLVFLLLEGSPSPAQTKSDSTGYNAWYVDGYHGGIIGHMPKGSFRDIVTALDRYPSWKVSFEIEPLSWKYLKINDPEVFHRIKKYLDDHSVNSRLEIVSPAYMQPYCWNISGESNIRQLDMGLRELHQSFPGYPVRTYAVQEPCWTSSLPQILKSFGFTSAVLKDPATAFGGYTRGINKSTIFWKGPDGTSIPAVPRYKCEELNKDAWETESCSVTRDFIRKCNLNGIINPVGNQYQDLGWPAHPAPDSTGSYVYIDPGLKQWPDSNQFDHYWWNKNTNSQNAYPHLTTWREYFKNLAPEPKDYWNLSQEDLQVTMMWGSAVLNAISKKVHYAERRILQTEKLSSMATVLANYQLPDSRLEYAWEQLLVAQHHDAWICPIADTNNDRWASLATLKTGIANQIASELTDESVSSLFNRFQTEKKNNTKDQLIAVLNPTGFERSENVEVTASFNPGTHHIEVSDPANTTIPCQIIPTRWYGDGSINTARVIFSASTPPLGYEFFKIKSSEEHSLKKTQWPCSISQTSGYEYTLETDLYKLIINTAKGGCITSLTDKSLNKEFVDQKNERLFNEYRGYFPLDKGWLTSKDSAASLQIIENGPLRLKVALKGKIGKYPFESLITLAKGEKQIDFKTKFHFDKEVMIGEPWEGKRPARGEHRKPCYDSRWKLQAFFPTPFQNQTLYKNAPYDVCKSTLDNTFFNTWNDIKHNVILDWVDLYDSISNVGLALFSDRTTSYSHGKDYPLALTMAWSGYGLWESFYPMSEIQEFNYALIPHSGKWNDAGISPLNSAWNEPLICRIINDDSKNISDRYSFMTVTDNHIEITALYIKNKSLNVRLFNSNDTVTKSDFAMNFKVQSIESTELDSSVIQKLEINKSDNRSVVNLNFRPFEIKTLKLVFR